MSDERELDNDGFDEDEDTDSTSESGDDAAPPKASDGAKDSGNSDKRISDLMSKWQSEQAKRQAAEARLAELEGQVNRSGDGPAESPKEDPQVKEFLELARTQARQALFTSDPRLAKYGIEPSVIEGSSAAEMKDSLARVQALIDKVEGSARTEVLSQHGLNPEIGAASGEQPRDFSAMSDKEILELGDRAIGLR